MSPDSKSTNPIPVAADLQQSEVPKQRPALWKSIKRVFLIIVILGFIFIGGPIFYRAWIVNKNLTVSLTAFSHQIEADQRQIAGLQNQLTSVQQQLQQQQDALQHQMQVVQEWRGLGQNGQDYWNVVDAQYFVRLANDHLLLTHDIPMTINLLNQAQNELNHVTDPNVLTVKKALMQDIATLKSIPFVNLTDVYMRLEALQKQVEQLPLPVLPVLNDESSSMPINAPESNLAWWQKGLQSSWQALRQMVVVRRLPSAQMPPFVTPDQRPFLFQNLHAVLDSAMWAVLHRDATIYQVSLQQAAEWIRHYFTLDSSITQAFLTELIALQRLSIQPAQEAVLVSPKAFQDYLKEQTATSKTVS